MLEVEQREDRFRPRRRPRQELAGGQAGVERSRLGTQGQPSPGLAPSAVEPLRREVPLSRVLHCREALFELGVGEKRAGSELLRSDRIVHERLHDRLGVVCREQLEASRIRCARRSRVENATAADRRPVAEDEAVVAGRDHRRGETKLGEAVAHPHDPARSFGRAVVDVHARVVADRLELGELDVEPVAHGIGAGLGERVSTVQRAALDSGQRERDPLARLGSVDRLVVHLDAAHPHVDPGRLGPQLVARADRARPQRSRDDGADPVQGEGAVDVEPRRAEQRLVLEAVGDRHERCTELVEPLAGLGADLDHSRARYELPGFALHQLERLRIGRIRFRHRDDAVLDAEQPQDRQMLMRLRACALGRVDDEQEEVDPAGPGDHVPDEPLMTGHVDQ